MNRWGWWGFVRPGPFAASRRIIVPNLISTDLGAGSIDPFGIRARIIRSIEIGTLIVPRSQQMLVEACIPTIPIRSSSHRPSRAQFPSTRNQPQHAVGP
jgi:hypothetical protein